MARKALQHSGVGVDEAVAALSGAYNSVRQEKIEQMVLKAMGLTWSLFHDRGVQILGEKLHMQVVQQIMNINMQVELLVAGMEGQEARIALVAHPGTTRWFDRPGFLAVGSGGAHASIALASSGQAPSASLAECAYRVYEAKKRAETAPGVGTSTDILVIGPGAQQKAVSPEALKELDRLYLAARALPEADYKNLAGLL